jgi:hypothetical protein
MMLNLDQTQTGFGGGTGTILLIWIGTLNRLFTCVASQNAIPDGQRVTHGEFL